MENRSFKLRFYRIFQASFFSCRSRKLSDVVTDKSISVPRNSRKFQPNYQRQSTHSPDIPRKNGTLILSENPNENFSRRRRKISVKFPPFLAPPASPISPRKMAPLCEFRDCLSREKRGKVSSGKVDGCKRKKSKKKKKTKRAEEKKEETKNNFGGVWWYRSEEDDTEDETETLFSSRSLTSDSSASRRHRRMNGRRKCEMEGGGGGGRCRPFEKVKDSFAVVKNSSDPYKDFKASMVEMIVEKEILSEKELEELLRCFISLNSPHYHSLILQVYTEIRDALLLSHFPFTI